MSLFLFISLAQYILQSNYISSHFSNAGIKQLFSFGRYVLFVWIHFLNYVPSSCSDCIQLSLHPNGKSHLLSVWNQSYSKFNFILWSLVRLIRENIFDRCFLETVFIQSRFNVGSNREDFNRLEGSIYRLTQKSWRKRIFVLCCLFIGGIYYSLINIFL